MLTFDANTVFDNEALTFESNRYMNINEKYNVFLLPINYDKFS